MRVGAERVIQFINTHGHIRVAPHIPSIQTPEGARGPASQAGGMPTGTRCQTRWLASPASCHPRGYRLSAHTRARARCWGGGRAPTACRREGDIFTSTGPVAESVGASVSHFKKGTITVPMS